MRRLQVAGSTDPNCKCLTIAQKQRPSLPRDLEISRLSRDTSLRLPWHDRAGADCLPQTTWLRPGFLLAPAIEAFCNQLEPERTDRFEIRPSKSRFAPVPAIFRRREERGLFAEGSSLCRTLLCLCPTAPTRGRSIPRAPLPRLSKPAFLFHSRELRTDEARPLCDREHWRYARPSHARLPGTGSDPWRPRPADKCRQPRPCDRGLRDTGLRNSAQTMQPLVPSISWPNGEREAALPRNFFE